MAFSLLFREGGRTSGAQTGGLPIDLLHRAECAACPLNHAPGLRHPKMGADGRADADIFFLGEAPGEEEDRRGHVMIGPAGRVLRMRVPERFLPRIRWGNVIRCHPPKNRDPTDIEKECCRPEVQRQIVASRPVAVVGFGNHALAWATGQHGITKWRGRRLPVAIAGHPCWFFPILHPSAIGRGRRFEPRGPHEYGSDDELAFAHDVRRALEAVEAGLPEPVVHTREDAERGVSWITGHRGWEDYEALRAALELAAAADASGVDLETNGRRPYQDGAKILTAAVATAEASVAFAVDHSGAGWTREQRDAVVELFAWYLREARGTKTVFNLAFEMEWIAVLVGEELLRAGRWDCSMVQGYILDERSKMGKPDALSLEFLCLRYFGINIKVLSQLNKDRLDDEPLEQVLRYNAIDARYHLFLHGAQEARLAEEGLLEVYEDRVRHVPTVVLTQVRGLPVDAQVVAQLDGEYNRNLAARAAEIAASPLAHRYQARYGAPFRPSANDDVRKLCALVGLHVDSADVEAWYPRLRDPIREPLAAWKKLAKAHSTYIKPMRDRRWPDGMVHTQLLLTSVETGRTSSEGPNTQNNPKRNEEHRRVRAQVSARAWQEHLRDVGHPDAQYEHVIVSYDWGQIQARCVAMESGDERFIRMLWDEYEIHGHWRDRLWQIYPQWTLAEADELPPKKRLDAYRNRSKNGFTFPSLFGAQPKKCAAELRVPEKIAIKLQEEFWDVHRGIKGWHEDKYREAEEYGYVSGLSGLRRRVPLTPNMKINSPIQADEAVIVLDAMTRCSEAGLQAILEVHDDLTFCWPRHKVDEYAETAIDIMLSPSYEWARVVPTVVEMSVGPDWANLSNKGLPNDGVFSSSRWR